MLSYYTAQIVTTTTSKTITSTSTEATTDRMSTAATTMTKEMENEFDTTSEVSHLISQSPNERDHGMHTLYYVYRIPLL